MPAALLRLRFRWARILVDQDKQAGACYHTMSKCVYEMECFLGVHVCVSDHEGGGGEASCLWHFLGSLNGLLEDRFEACLLELETRIMKLEIYPPQRYLGYLSRVDTCAKCADPKSL